MERILSTLFKVMKQNGKSAGWKLGRWADNERTSCPLRNQAKSWMILWIEKSLSNKAADKTKSPLTSLMHSA